MAQLIDGLGGDAALSLVYQAALQAATAVVRAAGYRVRGSGHHHHTFAAVAALGLGDVSGAARALDRARQMRHDAVYGWQTRTTAQDLAAVRSDTARLFAGARGWLTAERPGLGASLAEP